MVRGRRPRVTPASAVRPLDDPFAASPKRKDCKLDPDRRSTTPTTPSNGAYDFHGFGSGGSSKGRSRAITHYFPFAQQQQQTNSTSTSPKRPLDCSDGDLVVLVADDDDDAPHQRSTSSDSGASQRRRLLGRRLNVDPDPTDGRHSSDSSSPATPEHVPADSPLFYGPVDDDENACDPFELLVSAVAAHPKQTSNFAGALTASAVQCHDGQAPFHHPHHHHRHHPHAGSMAGSETDRSDDDGLATRSPSAGEPGAESPGSSEYLCSSDSNSCDSGVVADRMRQLQTQLVQQTPPPAAALIHTSKRRKPMTPHRIVCPSPEKRTADDDEYDADAVAEAAAGLLASVVQQQQQPDAEATAEAQPKPAPQSPSTALAVLQIGPTKKTRGRKKATVGKSALVAAQKPGRKPKLKLVAPVDPITGNQTDQCATFTAIVAQHEQRPIIGATKVEPQPCAFVGDAAEAPIDAPKAKPKDKLTDFFPVRRSVRKTRKAVELEQQRCIEMAIRNEQADGLRIVEFPNKGRGIMAARRFERGEFVVEYIGELIGMAEANRREMLYAKDANTGCYMYYFKHCDQQYCIDATAESGKLGRLVNHSRNGNLVTKTLLYRNRPHLVLLAKDSIEVGEELTYDYGDRSKESLLHHPWLAL